jgi:solute carrier family 25 (mitochondrial S-adenosylmethionine transporter), member 26
MESGEILRHMLSGAFAGVVVEAALYPLDTIKTRLQVAKGGVRVSWKSLYRGLGNNLLGVVPASAIFFAVYEPLKYSLLREGDLPKSGAHLLAASSGGLAASLIRVPTEVIKTRMQAGHFIDARSAAWCIVTKEGFLSGLFAGFGSFLLRDLPFDAIEFTSYEYLKLSWKSITKENELKQHEAAVFGAFAGMLTGAVTTPLDVVKARLMTQGGRISRTSTKKERCQSFGTSRYTGISDCFSRVVSEEGWRALFKGVGPRVTWIGVGGGIFFFTLETSRRCLEQICR